jgi:hypothetical protein
MKTQNGVEVVPGMKVRVWGNGFEGLSEREGGAQGFVLGVADDHDDRIVVKITEPCGIVSQSSAGHTHDGEMGWGVAPRYVEALPQYRCAECDASINEIDYLCSSCRSNG